MKKINLIFILILLISPIIISAQTSGWKDMGKHKEEVLVKDSLVSLCFSEDGTKFYTLHYNKIVYYWDVKTGVLIDSLIVPNKFKIETFSKDGHTIIGYDYNYPRNFSSSIFVDLRLFIIDLDTKGFITNSIFKMPGSMDCGYVDTHGSVYLNYGFNVMDFHYKDSTLDLAPSLIYLTMYGDVYTTLNHTALGGAAIFKVSKDTLIKILQITTLPTYDFVQVDKSYYISNFSLYEHFYGSSSLQSQENKYTNSFGILSNGNTANILYNEFKHSSYWEMGHRDGGSTDSGTKIPYRIIFYDNINDIIYVNAGAKYYYIRPYHKLDSIFIQSNYYLNEIMSKDFQYFIYPKSDSIFVHNVKNKIIEEKLNCSFKPLMIKLSPYGRSIIAANDHGKIALFEKTILKATTATLETENVSNVTSKTASSGGNIFDEGGTSITARGVCWSTSPNPTIADNKTYGGSGIGSFTCFIKGLSPNTIYYVRAYAINSIGTAYGNEISFSTLISSIPEISNNITNNVISIMPNPATDFIHSPEVSEPYTDAAIFSILGEKVMQIKNLETNLIDISGLSKGVYFLRINNKSYKFVKI
jgi:hypothetical protein